MRIEKDALGTLSLPDNVYYGVQTERARQNFAISGLTIGDHTHFIWSLATIKMAAARANEEIGMLDRERSEAIQQAAREVMDGKFADQFPVDIFQGGGETSANMNINEVVANRANEILTGSKGNRKIHPNTHVNLGQSTNDVIPSAVRMACYLHLQTLEERLEFLAATLARKKEQFADVVMAARTCLQDAVPITLGQEFSGYLAFVERQRKEGRRCSRDCLEIPLGATAVGTGLGAFAGYQTAVYSHLKVITGMPLRQDANLFDGLQNGDVYIRISAYLKGLATGLAKLAHDLRLLASGPRAGFGEITLPATQPGSSIMPGKVNPVIPEMIIQVSYQVCGHDLSISMAVEGGELDLNVWESLIMKCLFESFRLLNNSIVLFAERCIDGITAHTARCLEHAESSIALVTILAPIFGYQQTVEVAQKAMAENKTIKATVMEMGLLADEEAEELLNPKNLVDPVKCSQLLNRYVQQKRGLPSEKGN